MYIPWSTRLLLKFPLSSKAILKFRNFLIDRVTNDSKRALLPKTFSIIWYVARFTFKNAILMSNLRC